MIYRAYDELRDVPHVVVDGSAQPGTVLTLSHWPGSVTPAPLRADLSAEIAFRYLDHPELQVEAEWVTNNHFDQDGLVGVFALVDPATALGLRDRLEDVARAGDFSQFHEREAARAAITLAALGAEAEGDAYEAVLPRVPEVVTDLERFRTVWAEQDAHITATETAIAAGTVAIEEAPDLDVAVVRIPPDWAERAVQQFSTIASNAVHPYALHNATDRLAILSVRGAHVQLQYRYETWVLLESRRPRPRVDLTDLAVALTAQEVGNTRWTFDGVSALSPRLHVVGDAETSLEPEDVVAEIRAALAMSDATWSPYTD